ncbi:hypothetical protein K9M79_03050 [Candidatus Woesearchaeota archaeon]|nr:hypothetical protein [Candidatus Woesearchaeota archaeon]
MAAAELTETRVGALGQVVTITGKAVKVGLYTATKATQNDWVILGDFDTILEAVVYTVSSGARTAEDFTIDITTTNKVTLTSATTGSVSIVAIGY